MIYYKKKIQQDVGATAVEYGILSALIAVITILEPESERGLIVFSQNSADMGNHQPRVG